MLIVIYEYVYSMLTCKFGEDNYTKHIIISLKKTKKMFFVILKLVRPKVKLTVSKTGDIFFISQNKKKIVISIKNDELYCSPLNVSFI